MYNDKGEKGYLKHSKQNDGGAEEAITQNIQKRTKKELPTTTEILGGHKNIDIWVRSMVTKRKETKATESRNLNALHGLKGERETPNMQKRPCLRI